MHLRDSHKNNIPRYVLEDNGEIVEYSPEDFIKKYTYGVIRVHMEEASGIPTGGVYTHFNLSPCWHKVGHIYHLVNICGRRITDQYGDQPILSIGDATLYECVEVKEEVEYDEIMPSVFEHAMSHIQNTDDLSQVMVKRYSKFVEITHDELSCAPVAITYLKQVSD